MIVRVESQAEFEVSPGNTRASELYSWLGLVSGDAWIAVEGSKVVARWVSFLKDDFE